MCSAAKAIVYHCQCFFATVILPGSRRGPHPLGSSSLIQWCTLRDSLPLQCCPLVLSVSARSASTVESRILSVSGSLMTLSEHVAAPLSRSGRPYENGLVRPDPVARIAPCEMTRASRFRSMIVPLWFRGRLLAPRSRVHKHVPHVARPCAHLPPLLVCVGDGGKNACSVGLPAGEVSNALC